MVICVSIHYHQNLIQPSWKMHHPSPSIISQRIIEPFLTPIMYACKWMVKRYRNEARGCCLSINKLIYFAGNFPSATIKSLCILDKSRILPNHMKKKCTYFFFLPSFIFSLFFSFLFFFSSKKGGPRPPRPPPLDTPMRARKNTSISYDGVTRKNQMLIRLLELSI